MITVSLQPFAFRKIVVLLAALLWLTATVLFADPVLMNARADHLARHSSGRNSIAYAAGTSSVRTAPSRANGAVVEQTAVTPAEGPAIRSIWFDRLDTWSECARAPFATDHELTFWSLSLAR